MKRRGISLLVGGILGAGLAAAVTGRRAAKRAFDFHGKVVVITGGSRGLGLVLARRFAAEGAKIAICARDSKELARARQDLETTGAEVFEDVCDVTDRSAAAKFVEDVRTRFGRIDILVNNAGVIQVGPLESQTREDFENAMAIHFWGPFNMMEAVLPEMRERRSGRIVNVSSIGGKIAVPHLAPYCASKFALAGLSDAMRGELRQDNIYVTTVCPGLMRTGSHINAQFKSRNEAEFALFSLSNATPLSSIGAERAAGQIVEAARNGRAELVISVQAKLAVTMSALFPELTADALGMVNRLLPGFGGIGKEKTTGLESASVVSPSFITSAIDRASAENNELKPGEHI